MKVVGIMSVNESFINWAAKGSPMTNTLLIEVYLLIETDRLYTAVQFSAYIDLLALQSSSRPSAIKTERYGNLTR